LHYLKLLFRVYGNIARLGAFGTSLIFPGTVVSGFASVTCLGW